MEQIFDKIPKSSVEYVRGLISSENIIFKLKKSRRTKHGDFSIKKNGLVIITINEDLNAYRFLITLIHEISHYFSVKNYGVNIKPHGVEWKNTFKKLLLPIAMIVPSSFIPLTRKIVNSFDFSINLMYF